ncbi:hypothetical protein V8E55_004125, partial [Tylopilus felleus]
STSISLSRLGGTDQLTLADRNDTNGINGSPPQSPHIELSNLDVPTVASLLTALKKSEALEWRVSKRFSEYHFSKMTGSAIMSEHILPMSPNNFYEMLFNVI